LQIILTMSELTDIQMFEKAGLGHFHEDFIKGLSSSGDVGLTKNNFLLYRVDFEMLEMFWDYEKFTYHNLCIDISSIMSEHTVFPLNDMQDILANQYYATIMICETTDQITKKHIDEIKNMYCDDSPVYPYMSKESYVDVKYTTHAEKFSYYEFFINYDKEIFDIERYTIPIDKIENFYFDFSKGVLFNLDISSTVSEDMSKLNKLLTLLHTLKNSRYKQKYIDNSYYLDIINEIKQESKNCPHFEINEIIELQEEEETFKKIAGSFVEFFSSMKKNQQTSTEFVPDAELIFKGNSQSYGWEEILHNRVYSNDCPFSENDNSISPIFENLFQRIQVDFFDEGLYLLYRDNGFTITIGKPYGYTKELHIWHRFNKIPPRLEVDPRFFGTFS